MTEAEVDAILEAQRVLNEHALVIGEAYAKLTNTHWSDEAVAVIEDGWVNLSWDEVCFGEASNEGFSFPIQYLWEPDWKDQVREIQRQKREYADQEARRKTEAAEQRDRALYEKLRDRFGP